MNNDIKEKLDNLTDVEQIKAIKKDPTLLQYINTDFQRIYPGVVLDAVKINKALLEFVIPELKDFIEASVNNESINKEKESTEQKYNVVSSPTLKDGSQIISMKTEENKTR